MVLYSLDSIEHKAWRQGPPSQIYDQFIDSINAKPMEIFAVVPYATDIMRIREVLAAGEDRKVIDCSDPNSCMIKYKKMDNLEFVMTFSGKCVVQQSARRPEVGGAELWRIENSEVDKAHPTVPRRSVASMFLSGPDVPYLVGTTVIKDITETQETLDAVVERLTKGMEQVKQRVQE